MFTNTRRFARISEDRIFLIVPYREDGSHKIENKKLKDVVPSANWNKGAKAWSIPLSRENIRKVWGLYNNNIILTSGREYVDALKQRWSEREKLAVWAEKAKTDITPIALPGSTFTPRVHQIPAIRMIEHMPYTAILSECLHPDSLVKINNLYTPIKNAVKGKIIPLRGSASIQKVTTKRYSGNLIGIKTCGFDPLWLTPEHKIFAIKTKQCLIPTASNTECRNSCKKKCARKQWKKYTVEEMDSDKLKIGDWLLYPQTKPQEVVPVNKNTEQLLPIIGYYLTDGNLGKQKDRAYSTAFNFGIRQQRQALPVLEKAIKSLNLTLHDNTCSKNNMLVRVCNNYKLARYLQSICGELANKKHLPDFALTMTKEQKLTLLTAIFHCDTHVKHNTVGKDSASIRYCTVSRHLALGVRDLLLSIGIVCSTWTEEERTDNKGVHHQRAYRIAISRRFMHLFGYKVQQIKHECKQIEYKIGNDTYTILRVKKLFNKFYDGKVYDITSTGHPSFLTESGIVHNCGSGKSFMTLSAIALMLKSGFLTPGKILLIAPLTVLYGTWLEDGPKMYPWIRFKSLWANSQQEIIKEGLPRIIADHGLKPKGTVKVKHRQSIVLVNDRDEVYLPDSNQNPVGFRHKKLRKCSIAVLEDGREFRFGKETLISFKTRNIKADNIRTYLQDDYDIFLTNHDMIHTFEDLFIEHGFEGIFVDESSRIKNASSKEYRSLLKIAASSKRRVIMSGTPAPNGPQDLWSQFMFLDGGLSLQPNKTDFMSTYFKKFLFGLVTNKEKENVGEFHHVEWKPQSDSLERINAQISPFTYRVKLRDCVDLPPLIKIPYDLPMDIVQQRIYDELDETLRAEITEDDSVEVHNALTKILRLSEITGGFSTNENKEVIPLPVNMKLNALDDVLEKFGSDQSLIFASRTWELTQIMKKLGNSARLIDGTVDNPMVRKSILDSFRAGNFQYLVCQPKTASHGLNLQFCHYAVFYSFDYNGETMHQALKRLERIGQTEKMVVYFLMAKNTIDHIKYSCLVEKENIQQQLINQEVFAQWLRQRKLSPRT